MTKRPFHIAALVLAALAAITTMFLPLQVSADPFGTEPMYYDRASATGGLSGGQTDVPVQSMSPLDVSALVSANVQVISDSGPSSNRVDVVFLGDGYMQENLATYGSNALQLMSGLLLQAPFYEYSPYFNFHRVDVVSGEAGIDHDPAYGTLKSTALDSQFWCQGVSDILCTNVGRAWEYANLARNVDQIVVLVNSTQTGGAAYPFSDLALISAGQTRATDNFAHQFGHSFGNLADEFSTGSWPEYTGFEPAEPNASPQNSAAMALQRIKWYRWLGADMGPQYGGLIGTYEGAMGHTTKIYRPTSDSKMRSLNAPFNNPSVEAIIGQIYRLVSPIDDATPANATLNGSSTITVKPLQPIGRNLKIQWYMNGTPVEGATGKTFRPNDYPFADGTYTASVTVTDDTSLVRDEAMRSQYMTASRSWTVPVDQNPPIILTHPVGKTVFVGQSAAFSVTASGEDIKYQWYKNGSAISGATSSTYVTPAATRADTGAVFRVRVYNVGGYVDSNNAVLGVGNRLPILPTLGTLSFNRSQTKEFPLTVIDLDGDTVSLSAALVAQNPSSGASVSMQGTKLVITTNSSFIGEFQVKLTASDGFDSVSTQFTVTVANQAPTITPIAAQMMHWRTDTISVPIAGADADNDSLTFSATLLPANSAPVALSIAGNQLTVNPDSGYLGSFTVSVSVSDGRTSTATTFTVTVYDTAPAVQAISDKSMFWKTDFINVPVSATDADGDTLFYTASLSGSNPPVALSFSGSTLKINPAVDYIGKFNVKVDVSDTKKTTSVTFAVDVYNSRPTLTLIPDQEMHRKVDFIKVPVSATDPDGDTLTYSARLAQPTFTSAVVTMNGQEITINPAEDYLGTFQVIARASDSNSFIEQTFKVTVYNRPPVIDPIADQRIHWLQDKKVVTIRVTDPDNEVPEVEAELIGTVVPEPVITLNGNEITIDPADEFLGSFAVRVKATDGIATDSRSFAVTSYNTPPDLKPICDRSASWKDLPYDITLVATDDDDEELEFSASVEKSMLPYELDQANNFAASPGGWYYNLLGLNEKYFQGDKNQAQRYWFMILPTGELYEFAGSVAKSTLVASLPVAFYHDPTLLFDVPVPVDNPPVTVSTEENILTVDAPTDFRGTVVVRARVSDHQLFDEESFLLTIYDGTLSLEPIPTQVMHWTENSRDVTLHAVDTDGNQSNTPIVYSAYFTDVTEAHDLDQQHHFGEFVDTAREAYAPDNATGRNEKYFLGGPQLNNVYAILPGGQLYACAGSRSSATLASSTYLTRLPKAYYEDPSLLFDAPPSVPPPIELDVSNSTLSILPTRGFIGKVLVTAVARAGSAVDEQTFILNVYNTTPKLDRDPATLLPIESIKWNQPTASVPFTMTDNDNPDQPNLMLTAHMGGTHYMLYELDQKYDFKVGANGLRYNELGWRERHLEGTNNGVPADFAVMPSGSVYDWRGTIQNSVLVATVWGDFYKYPEQIVDKQKPPGTIPTKVQISLQNNTLKVIPDPEFQHGFLVTLLADDGNKVRAYDLNLGIVNGLPVITRIEDQLIHWRTDKLQLPIVASDPEGEALAVDAALQLPGSPLSKVPANVSVTNAILTVDPLTNYLGSFYTYVMATTAANDYYSERMNYIMFQSVVYNNAPTLGTIGARDVGYRSVLNVALSGSDADAPDQGNLVYSARLGTYSHLAYQLDQVHHFALITQNHDLNARGYNEKYIRGTKNGSPTEYVIFPTGALYEWNGSFPVSQKVAQLPVSYYTNPSLLFGVANPGSLPAISVTTNGANLTVDPGNVRYTGVVPVTVEVTDGNKTASETFTISYANRAPTLAAIGNIQRHWRQGAITIPLVGTDADGDTLTYSAAQFGTNAAATVAVSGSNLTITPTSSTFTGAITVKANVTDGNTTDSKTFTVTYYNTAPVLQGIPDQQLGWRQTFIYNVIAVDQDNDPLTYTAAPAAGSANLINVSIANKVLTVSPKTPFNGSAQATVTVNDGLVSAQYTFSITYTNRAPTLNAIADQTMKWNEKTRSITLVATDPDNDPLTYTGAVTVNPTAATITMTGSTLKYTLTNYFSSFYITAYVYDGKSTISRTFRVDVTNVAPVITPVAEQKVHWRTTSVSVPVSASDSDGDTPTLTAKLQTGQNFPATVSYSGGNVNISLTQKQLGSFNVEVSATDPLVTTKLVFKVTVGNTAPEIADVPDQVIAYDVSNVTVPLQGTDANEDPLTYTAQIVSIGEYVYTLDQTNNFELRFGDYYFNKLGNNEKYIQGTKNVAGQLYWYVIYPNGRFYEWSGQLTTSTYLGTFPTEYYTDPSKFFNVAAPSPANVQAQVSIVDGSNVKITASNGYIGQFWVRIDVTDTKASAMTYFGVQRAAAATDDDDGEEDGDDTAVCTMTTKLLCGDYSCSGTTIFQAEGRIGDTATGAGSRTHELSVSRSTSGSFATGEKSNYVWKSGVKTPFKVIYDPETRSAQLTVGTTSVSHVPNVTRAMTDIFLRTRSNKYSSVVVEQLKLNGQTITKTVGASKSLGTTNVLQVTTGGLDKRFVLEGNVTMTFSGSGSTAIKDSDLSFQVTLSSISGHSTTCVDPDNGHKVTVCHIPPGNPSNAHTIKISPSALPAHLAHGDVIGECPGQPNDPGDGTPGGETCEQKQIIANPNYTLWNSFLGMIDILELTNPSNNDMPVKISFYSILGELVHQKTVTVPAVNQFDVIINDFPGFVRDSYGVVKLEFSGPLDGRMMYYRPSADGLGYDFAFDMPLSDPNFGTTAVGFNTFQPSMKDDERNNLVANWLSIVNLDGLTQTYSVRTYDTVGTLILSRVIEVTPFGRADIDGGHDLAGPNVVGIHIIEPHNVTARYIAQLTRFGGDAPAGFAPSKYKFAFPLSAKLGQSDPIYAPISNTLNEYNWLEVVNILDKAVGASINFYARDGRLLESLDATINPHAQLHFNAGSYLGSNETGYASIVPREPYSIVAQSMGYLREPVAGGITAVYGSQARRALPCVQSGSYNLFLNMKNYLLVANTTNNTIEATIQLTGPNLMTEKALTLAPRASVYIPIHEQAQFGARPDTYGLIAVRPRDTTLRLFAEVMRVRYRANGAPDFAAPTPVR